MLSVGCGDATLLRFINLFLTGCAKLKPTQAQLTQAPSTTT